jgi:redox-sensitive bicupin YhaK (pirin superfamily)
VGSAAGAARLAQHTLAVLGDGDEVKLAAGEFAARAILVAGRPLREPVARYGPFVMNTQEQLRQAFEDYRSGRF